MIAQITDNHFINLGQVTQGSEEALVKWFSVRSPDAFYRRNDLWDGWYRKYNTVKQRLALPFLGELKKCCKAHNIPLEIVDSRPPSKYLAPQSAQITKTLLTGVTLDDYQVRGLQTCCTEEIGILQGTTGSGKTELMCGLVAMFRCPTVIITEQIVVLEQIVKRLEMRQVVHNNDIGLFCYGNMPDGNLVIVGSIQSLSSPKKPKPTDIRTTTKEATTKCQKWAFNKTLTGDKDLVLYRIFPKVLADALYEVPDGCFKLRGKYLDLLIQYVKRVKYSALLKWYKSRITKAKQIQEMVSKSDMLLVDECDLAVTPQYAQLFRNYFHGRRKYGFSATPFEKNKPVENLVLRENMGIKIFEAPRTEVQAAGRIIPIKFHMIVVGPEDRHDSRTFDIAMREVMIDNKEFHQLVSQIVSSFPKDGTLILVDTSPIEELGVALEEAIPGSKFIFGGTPKKIRREVIGAFERREMTCLIGSKILKRGLDLKGGVENLIIVGGGAMWTDFDQKVGRAVRKNIRGWARVFSFFFINNKYLYRHSKESLKALLDMGYEAHVHVNGIDLDGAKFVRSNFRLPK